MANQSNVTVVADGHRNAVVQIVGVLDSGDMTLAEVIRPANFIGNRPTSGALTGFRVDKIQFSVSSPLTVKVAWDSATPQLIAALTGVGKLCFQETGGINPDATAAGYTGSISVSTAGYVPGSTVSFTLSIEMIKQF